MPRAATRRASVATTPSVPSATTPDAQRPQRSDDPQPKAKPAAKPADEQPKADAPAQEPTTEEPTEGAPRLDDARHLRAAAREPAAPHARRGDAHGRAGAGCRRRRRRVRRRRPRSRRSPRSTCSTASLRRSRAAEAPTAEAPTQGATAATPGGIPLPFLAGLATEAQTDLPKIELPTELPTADAAAPQLDTAAAAPECGRRAALAGLLAAAAQPAGGPERRCAGEQARRRAGPGRHDAAAHPGRAGGAARGRRPRPRPCSARFRSTGRPRAPPS